jgi:hypothetical protein
MKHRIALLAANAISLSLVGCVGDGVEFGGVGAPVLPPVETVPCQTANLQRVKQGHVFLHQEVLYFFFATGGWQTANRTVLTYDVTSAGQPVNVRYSGPPQYLRHTTRQKLIRAASDYVQETRYAPTQVYATGCEFELNYVVRWQLNGRQGEPPPNI